MSKSKIKKMLILLMILFVLLLTIIIVIYNNSIDRKLRYIYNDKKDGNIEIMPTNVDKVLASYKGDISQRSLYKELDYFANEVIEKYYLKTRDLDDGNLESYYNENQQTINKELGITEANKFSEFCKNLKDNLNGDTLKLTSYTFYPDDVEVGKTYTKCSLIINYNNNQKIAFYLYIQNTIDKTKTPIYYESCLDENILSYEYIENDYETPDSIEPTGKVIE